MENDLKSNDYPFDKGEYHSLIEALDEVTEHEYVPEEVSAGRGGSRPGAGRKRVYEEGETQRLKCRVEVAELANALISMLDCTSGKIADSAVPCRMDGYPLEIKGKGARTWSDADAVNSRFCLSIGQNYDLRIFALAMRLCHPEGVALQSVQGDMVRLRWQRVDELAKLMMHYGSLLARKGRMSKVVKEIYDGIPKRPKDIIAWVYGKKQ